MKVTMKWASMLLIFLAVACSQEGKKVEATEAKKAPETTQPTANEAVYALNKGTLNWTGSKLLGTSSHNGTISVATGMIKAIGNQITSGQFTIDMASINNLDLEAGQGKEKLEGHLKSPDFFDVAQFPSASFEVTAAAPVTGQEDITHNITGNLTLKNVTKSITFPANVAIIGNKITAVSPAFKIDRTQWGVEYGSESIAGLAKDKVISNEIALVLNIEASSNAPVQ